MTLPGPTVLLLGTFFVLQHKPNKYPQMPFFHLYIATKIRAPSQRDVEKLVHTIVTPQ